MGRLGKCTEGLKDGDLLDVPVPGVCPVSPARSQGRGAGRGTDRSRDPDGGQGLRSGGGGDHRRVGR